MKNLVFVAAFFMSFGAMAVDGTMDIRMNGWSAKMNATQTGDLISGDIINLAGNSGPIKLEKINGTWVGKVGNSLVEATELQDGKKGRKNFTIRMSPGGQMKFTVNYKKGVAVSGFSGGKTIFARTKKNAREFSCGVGNFYSSYKRVDTTDMLYYGGSEIEDDEGGLDRSISTLDATGSLDPRVIENDPVLMTILYALPYLAVQVN